MISLSLDIKQKDTSLYKDVRYRCALKASALFKVFTDKHNLRPATQFAGLVKLNKPFRRIWGRVG